MTDPCDKLKIGDWCWIQDYDCPICRTKYAVGFLTKSAVLPCVECENCGWDMDQVDPPPDEQTTLGGNGKKESHHV